MLAVKSYQYLAECISMTNSTLVRYYENTERSDTANEDI